MEGTKFTYLGRDVEELTKEELLEALYNLWFEYTRSKTELERCQNVIIQQMKDAIKFKQLVN